MIHDPPKMGFNFESVRTEDEKMTMLINYCKDFRSPFF